MGMCCVVGVIDTSVNDELIDYVCFAIYNTTVCSVRCPGFVLSTFSSSFFCLSFSIKKELYSAVCHSLSALACVLMINGEWNHEKMYNLNEF